MMDMAVPRECDRMGGCNDVNDEREQQDQLHGHGIEVEREHLFVLSSAGRWRSVEEIMVWRREGEREENRKWSS